MKGRRESTNMRRKGEMEGRVGKTRIKSKENKEGMIKRGHNKD